MNPGSRKPAACRITPRPPTASHSPSGDTASALTAPSVPGPMGTRVGPEPGGAFLMRRLKAAFDPQGILEPARSVFR